MFFNKKNKKEKVVEKIVASGINLGVYSLFDKTSEEFNAPFVMKNDKLAVKATKTFIESKNDQISFNDFDLYRIGNFDPMTGSLACSFEKYKVDIN